MSKAPAGPHRGHVEGGTPAKVIAAYGVSRSWLYELLAPRYRAEGNAAFQPRWRRPRTSSTATDAATTQLVLWLRKQLCESGLDARGTPSAGI